MSRALTVAEFAEQFWDTFDRATDAMNQDEKAQALSDFAGVMFMSNSFGPLFGERVWAPEGEGGVNG